jgi:hypothetical protein
VWAGYEVAGVNCHLQFFRISLWKDRRLPIEGKHDEENPTTGFDIRTMNEQVPFQILITFLVEKVSLYHL